MQNKKLLFLINELRFFFSHRLSLANAAKKAGYEIHVASPPSPESEKLSALGFTFHPVQLSRKGINPFQEFRSIISLCKLYRRVRPDIVHHFTIKPILYGGIAARLTSVPAMVNAVTGLGYVFISKAKIAKLIRLFSLFGFYFAFHHKNMRVIFQNPDDQQQFVKSRLLAEGSALLIKGSGVPINEYTPLPDPDGKKIVVLLPARMLWDKGVSEFVQAADYLRKKIDIRMVLVGPIDSGNPSSITQQQIDIWVKQGLVEYWGFQKDIREAYQQCHIVCLPSYREGTPRALIEAAACSRAIVATDVPGCRDIVIDNENGLLVPAQNALALAAAIEVLVKNPQMRAMMAARGREIVEEGFSAQLVNQKTLDVYKVLSTPLSA